MVTKLRNYFSSFQVQSSISGSPTALICSICGNDQIITGSESGEMICRRCGQVISDRIQETLPEWRNFPDTDESKNRNRTGMSESLARNDMALSTIIGRSDKDASGHPLDAVMRTTMDTIPRQPNCQPFPIQPG
jgi:transcription initiation factor TFIIB